jgi:hypothetical protein
MLDKTKVIEIIDPVAQEIKETVIDQSAKPVSTEPNPFNTYKNTAGQRMTLSEVAALTTSQFPSLLKDGLRPILYETYANFPSTWQLWADQMQSDKPYEDWLEFDKMGIAPLVPEGDAYPHVKVDFDRTVQIKNNKYGFILPITKEMIRFDRVNMIRQLISDLGPTLAYTKEQKAYDVITTTANYDRATTDCAAGAVNYSSTAFSATGVITALNVLRTQWEATSGRYLGVMPDTLICGPQLEYYAKQLLLADLVVRQHGNTSAEVIGTGQENPLRPYFKQIIVSPFMQSTAWVVMEAKKAVVVQNVEGPEIIQATMTGDNYNYLNYDVLEYRISEWFGVGMLNSRFAYYSTGGTPAVT